MKNKKELCDFGCGRVWDEPGDEDGFEVCVSAYHKSETKENWRKDFRNEFQNDEMFSDRVPEIWCDAIELFISTTIKAEREKIIKAVRLEKKKCVTRDCEEGGCGICANCSWNLAVGELNNKIEKL